MKSTEKFHEVKDFVKQQSLFNFTQASKRSKNFDGLLRQEQEQQDLKNTSFKADKVYSSKSWDEKKNKKQPVLKGRMIKSERSDKILNLIKNNKNNNSKIILENQKTLGRALWALNSASQAKITDGLSLHDMSCLLEKYADIKLYPVNISKTLKTHSDYFKLQSQEKKTKRYLLTPKGKREFKKLVV